jgi:glycosyltransferase involved in cell wall biosynthesis
MKPFITVFTPVYNREKTLQRLYESLCKQSVFNFEWLIVNDGSKDGSEKLIQSFMIASNKFKIQYYYKENGGKHRAINYGVSLAVGDLFFIVDSDDWLANDAIETIIKNYNSITDKRNYAGVAGTRCFEDGCVHGCTFDGEYIDATSLERRKLNIIGEKSEVFRTEILRKYPFPEYEGELFISEGIVWNKIAADGYKLRWFNYPIYYMEYQEDGLTNNLRKLYRNNPHGYLAYVCQEMKLNKISYIKRLLTLGKCLRTLEDTTMSSNEVTSKLEMSKVDYFLARLLFPVYKMFR